MDLLRSIGAAGLAAFLIVLGQAFAFQIFAVSSASMSPTLLPGDFVFVDRLDYHLRPPSRGDLILFHYPQADGRGFLKRVVGVPGDTVEERDGDFWVNGEPLAWSEIHPPSRGESLVLTMPPTRIPAGQFFVLGDNPNASLDSRFWGTVNIREVVGKALLICWSHGAHWWDVRWNRIGRWLP